MRTGIAAATSDLILFYDADQPYPLEDVDRLLRALAGGADVATASPWAEGGSDQGVPAGRRALSRGAALAYRLVVGPSAHGVATFTCAFRAWRAPLLRSLAFRSDGFGAAAEMLGLALLEGARVAEVPSRLRARTAGASKMRVPRALAEHLRVLARLWRRRARGRAGRMTPA
jgi:dolichol-phosphate mannosyltransferase